MGRFEIHTGDCLDVMRSMPDNSVDSIVTDPPYHLTSIVERFGKPGSAPAKSKQTGAFARASRGFMGQQWDGGDIAFRVETWAEAYRILKPGGYLAAFSGTRTYHRMAVAIEDAGFDIRDQLAWTYGSGFPKSRDISKDIDKIFGAKREVVGSVKAPGMAKSNVLHGAQSRSTYSFDKLGGAVTEDAKRWQGWGTALKPAWEPICLARKPLIGTVAANVLAHGTGALNIDGCRVATDESTRRNNTAEMGYHGGNLPKHYQTGSDAGRWPANLIHDGSPEVTDCFPNDTARFFYCAKASKADRGEGNDHPTVKPTDLMRWLCRLITPPGGTVFDPFTGSGSTGRGALMEGFRFIGAELSEDYVKIAIKRIQDVKDSMGML